jgi:hypothetical protein
MAASRRKSGYDKQQRASPPVTALDSSAVKDCKPTDQKPVGTQAEEIEPLDEKSLEQVVRECPL